jgi:D-alanyl-D-alanine carboxypeptidase/D-alanyl-D-alanine-endopeptidase (penicillin-binding protein 4)
VARLPHAQTIAGGCVIDLRAGQPVFLHNADAPLVPASTMKVFAMAAALVELGPDFHFETILATDTRNLYVIGDGDPGFGDERIHKARGETVYAPFDRWARHLLTAGVTAIPGDLVIDESIFDGERIHPTWEAEDLGKWYAAAVNGLNINDNCVDVTITPGAKAGAPVLVSVQPESPLTQIVNNCRTGEGTPVLNHAFGSYEYKIGGRCNKPWPFESVAFPDPGLLFADSFRANLAKKGITLQGDILRKQVRTADGKLPPDLSAIDRHRTPLLDALGRAGKNSQNLFAECLLKRAGYAWATRSNVPDPQGSWETGAAAVMQLIAAAGIDNRGLKVVDGSGLSRENTCTARQLAALLAWTYRQPFNQALYESLSEAGVDGSLQRRLKNLDGRVHAKTGTMRGIRTLAGYVDDEAGPRYRFAIMFNGYRGGSGPYKEIQDRFCKVLVESAKD